MLFFLVLFLLTTKIIFLDEKYDRKICVFARQSFNTHRARRRRLGIYSSRRQYDLKSYKNSVICDKLEDRGSVCCSIRYAILSIIICNTG